MRFTLDIIYAEIAAAVKTKPASKTTEPTARRASACTARRLAHKAEVNTKNNHGQTPLYWAAGKGQKDMVELLLANQAEVNAKDNEGQTPLHRAAVNGRKVVAELLLAHGAEVNAKDINRETPLYWAEYKGYKDVAELLRQHGGHE